MGFHGEHASLVKVMTVPRMSKKSVGFRKNNFHIH